MEKWEKSAITKIAADGTGQHLIQTDNSTLVICELHKKLKPCLVLGHDPLAVCFSDNQVYYRFDKLMAENLPQNELTVLIERFDNFNLTFEFRQWLQHVENYGGLVVATSDPDYVPERNAFEQVYKAS